MHEFQLALGGAPDSSGGAAAAPRPNWPEMAAQAPVDIVTPDAVLCFSICDSRFWVA